MKFYPHEKGGGDEVLATLKEGHEHFWGSIYAVAGSSSHIVERACKVSTFLKGGGKESFTVFFPFCSPPFPVINDQPPVKRELPYQQATPPSHKVEACIFTGFPLIFLPLERSVA